jgi:hypothetical protein
MLWLRRLSRFTLNYHGAHGRWRPGLLLPTSVTVISLLLVLLVLVLLMLRLMLLVLLALSSARAWLLHVLLCADRCRLGLRATFCLSMARNRPTST